MRQYSDSILEMLKKDEGYVGQTAETMKRAHSKTNTDYGAYYDSRGYLTTGYGSLISTAPKGSEQEKKDIEMWTKRTQYDPFTLTEDQASEILPMDIDRVTSKARSQLAVPFEDLPEQAQQAVVSLSYNTGTLGKNTAAAINKAMETNSTSAWKQVAKMVENWHGSKSSEQPAGVLQRRKREASLFASIEGLTPEGSDSEITLDMTPDGEEGNQVPSIISQEESMQFQGTDNYEPQPATTAQEFGYTQDVDGTTQVDYVEPRGKIDEVSRTISRSPAMQEPTQEQIMANSPFRNTRYDQNIKELEVQRDTLEKPVLEQAGDFGNHLINSFMTENIVGSSIKKAILLNDVSFDYKEGFDPTKMLGFQDMIMGIPPEKLKEFMDAPNEKAFERRIIGYKIEEKAREEISQYMAANPIKGFVGIGVASALDVTSFIPVGKMAQFVGLSKAARGIPATARAIGAGIAENVIQDLAQEALLIQNSDIRKWEDGDVLYGLVGSTVLGGAAGAFKASKGFAKYEKLAQKYSKEKNLSGIEMIIKNAKNKNMDASLLTKLETTKKFIEQELMDSHRVIVANEISSLQERIGKGVLDTKKVEIVKKQMEFNNKIDEQIALERAKPNVVQQAIDEVKANEKIVRAEYQKPINDLLQENIESSKKIKEFKARGAGNELNYQIKKLEEKIAKNNETINTFRKQQSDIAKKFKGEKNRAVKAAKKMEDPRELKIQELEASKAKYMEELKLEYDTVVKQVEDGSHPSQDLVTQLDSINQITKDLGLNHLEFKSIDDLDEFLGLKFDDSTHKSAGAAARDYRTFIKAGDVNTYFNNLDGDLWNVIARSAQEATENPALGLSSHQVNKNGVYAQLLRTTRLNELLTTDSQFGRFVLNKSSIRSGDNELARGFYNLFAPDGVGRVGEGKFSVIEKKQQVYNIHMGRLLSDFNEHLDEINAVALQNKSLRERLGLHANDLIAKGQMLEVGHPEKVAEILRDELINSGSAKELFGDEVGSLVEKMANKFDAINNDILTRAKEVGVKNTEQIFQGENTKGWFHRTWDNKLVREFYAKYGEDKLIELVDNSMIKYLTENGVELTDEIIANTKTQAKKFAYGIHNSDLEVNKYAKLSAVDYLESLIEKGIDETEAIAGELKALKQRAENAAAKELGKRKPLDLDGFVKLNDGTTVYMKDLLEKNILVSQKQYLESMSARIAAAENGIKDIDVLDQWAEAAHALEKGRGKIDSADYILAAMKDDIQSFRYGASGLNDGTSAATKRLLAMAKKYQFAKLMQYTGISSIAEMGTLIPEAGYKAVSQAITADLGKVIKSLFLGGVTGKEFTNKMYKELSTITGVGLEDIGYDALISSSNKLTDSKWGNRFERIVDNAAKATRHTTAHIEVIGRRLAVNSLAINFGDIALGRSQIDSLFGGLSNRNLVELGLADLNNAGKAVPNEKWNKIMSSIKEHALDINDNKAALTGEPIAEFNINKWDVDTRRTFGDALTQQANHIMVNPDSTTSKLWHNTLIGSIYNQFKTFSNNAASKVAGHNVNQAIQGYKMGSLAELSKTAQKYFWGAALGKLSLVLYGAINEAGRPDYEQRMEKYLHMDDPRDWTRALGRSSAITGLDTVVDTGLGVFGEEAMFDSSTIGQSRNRLDLMSTPTGQIARDAMRVGEYTAQKKYDKAGKTLLKMSPIRRQIGVNQLLNSMGID